MQILEYLFKICTLLQNIRKRQIRTKTPLFRNVGKNKQINKTYGHDNALNQGQPRSIKTTSTRQIIFSVFKNIALIIAI